MTTISEFQITKNGDKPLKEKKEKKKKKETSPKPQTQTSQFQPQNPDSTQVQQNQPEQQLADPQRSFLDNFYTPIDENNPSSGYNFFFLKKIYSLYFILFYFILFLFFFFFFFLIFQKIQIKNLDILEIKF